MAQGHLDRLDGASSRNERRGEGVAKVVTPDPKVSRTSYGVCSTEAEVIAQVQKTVIHEVAHHFGISDPRLEELGWE
jgi:hypothetical protein